MAKRALWLAAALITVFVPAQKAPGQALPQTPPPSSSLAPAPPPSVSAGVFPLDQVRRGQHGVAYTVFEGTQPEPMDLEILGVLHNMRGPGQDMILARLTGAKPEYTGVVAGMSGSPVYIDGKLVGALAFRIGQFSKEPIAGITPIAEMLQVRDETLPKPSNPSEPGYRYGPRPIDGTGVADLQGAGAGMANTEVRNNGGLGGDGSLDSSLIHPIETPLVFNGYSTEAIKLWQNHAALNGQSVDGAPGNPGRVGMGSLDAVAGVGGSSSNQPQPEPIVPGSAVSAILVRGDLDISATCTVTYVDAKQLLACGHPITQFGPISMPMTKAEVVATLASPLNAFKIVNTTETVGSFDQDRESAIRGEFGASARMLPVAVRIHGSANGGQGTASAGQEAAASDHTTHFEVIDQPEITPAALMVSAYQSLLSSNGYAAETTFRLRGSLELDGLPTVKFDSVLAPNDQTPSSLMAALLIGERFERLYDDSSRRTNFKDLSLDIEAIPGRQVVQIESATTDVTRVHAGQSVVVSVTIRPYRGQPRNVSIPFTLPANLQPGPLRLLLSDGGTLDRVMQPARPSSKPLDLNDTIEQLNSLHPNDRLYVTLLNPAAQASLEGRTLSGLPISMANILEPLRNNQEMTLNGESVLPVTSIAVDGAVTGQQVISFDVE